ncbi:hypothetical protein LWI29_033556 [Acer saccharum]|nr:hypothetical protein LWI29_033556 [Acer saccharum]
MCWRVEKSASSEINATTASSIPSLSTFGTLLKTLVSLPFPLISFLKKPLFLSTPRGLEGDPRSTRVQGGSSGAEEGEVKVEVEDDRVLLISGERNVEKEDKNDTWHRMERSSGKFSRRFRLPENVKMDHIKALMENGVLTVTVPKQEAKKPDVKAVEISG